MTPRFKRSTRGFTLTELMVAVTGGLFISLAVFALAREGSRFYQREQRVSDATLAVVTGFERLKSDIARAGFLGTPNVRRDPHLCGNPVGDATWPAELERMASVRITQDLTAPAGSGANTTLNANGRFPASILLSGSYSASEQFPIWNVQIAGATFIVFLQFRTGPLGRLGYAAASPADQLTMLQNIFGLEPGKGLRIQDQSGEIQFGTITQVTAGLQPSVTLNQSPQLRFRDAGANVCGLKGNVTGATVNPISFIQYDVRSLAANAAYAPIYANNNQAGDADRVELVREELDTSGTPIPNTQELVAQFTVDLKFSLTVATSINNASDPVLGTVPDDEVTTTWAGDVSTLPGNVGPERIKSVRVRLSVRSRDADRGNDITAGGPIAPGLYRIGVGDTDMNGSVAPPGPPFARVRNLQADIALNNQMGVFW